MTPESKERLLARVPPVHRTIHADHATIAFRPHALWLWWFRNFLAGKKARLRVTGVAGDALCQAVAIEGVVSFNDAPHVTISTAEGIAPEQSNALLQKAKVENRIERVELELEAVFDTFPRSKSKWPSR